MDDHNTVIKLEGVSKKYKLFEDKKSRMKEALHPLNKQYHSDFYALSNISLDVHKGEILGIVGMNGSGKSTMLKIISGIIQPSAGTVNVTGHVVPLLELGSGFNPEFTGLENIYFYNSIHGYNRKQTDAILDSILDFAEIGSFIHQPLKTYSSGMKARLAFAVSVNIDPDILILDEVLSVGDELFRRKCYARMEEFFKGGKTVIFVSHSVQSINQMCNRVVFLNAGEIILEGPTKMVTAQYERYLFAKKENMLAIRKEIVLMNQDVQLKEATYAEIEIMKNGWKPEENSALESNNEEKQLPQHALENIHAKESRVTTQKSTGEELQKKVAEFIVPKAYFIPGLVPKSRVEYRNSDVDITDVCILTPGGEKVNVLLTGEKYIYKYKVTFHVEAKNIVFGMMIKTEKGLEISGMNSRSHNLIVGNVSRNETFSIAWTFTCNFLHGNYYTNAGVSEYINGEHIYLNRIVDAMAFKVQQPDNIAYSGIVYIDQFPEIVFNI